MNALSPGPRAEISDPRAEITRGDFSLIFPGFLLISPFSWRFLLEIFGTSSEITRRDSPGSCSCGAVSSTHCFIRFQMNGEPQVGATFAVILCPDTTFRDPAGRWRPKISMSHSEIGGWRQCRRRKSERLRASRQHGPTLCLLWTDMAAIISSAVAAVPSRPIPSPAGTRLAVQSRDIRQRI